jgi:hypothetical protein
MSVPVSLGNAVHGPGPRPPRWHWWPAGIGFWIVVLGSALLWVVLTAVAMRVLT